MSADTAVLAEIPIFALIDDQERATLAELVDIRRFETGEIIFHYGARGDEIYMVREGKVQVFVTNDTGEQITLGENTRGDVFGEISLLDGGPRTASAIAVEPTEVLTLDRDQLLELVEKHPHVALDLLTVIGRRLRATDELLRTQVARNPNIEEEERLTFGQRIADRVAAFGGSWTFIITFAVILLSWVVLNSLILAKRAFDEYPYILLNLFLSMLAALQAPVIMMSQNRQSAKDRLKADLDYEVNLKAELEVAQLHRKIDRLNEELVARMPKAERKSEPARTQ